jgi:hypothetical protein
MVALISKVDYADRGLDIQSAMLDAVSDCDDMPAPPFGILWHGKTIQTGDRLLVGQHARARIDITHHASAVRQGIDLKVNGHLELKDRSKVELLRTWADEGLEKSVEYPFQADDGILHVWNVFERLLPNGQSCEEKWTGNAGFWVEHHGPLDRTYHCSHGMAAMPDFEALVFRVSVA